MQIELNVMQSEQRTNNRDREKKQKLSSETIEKWDKKSMY